MNRSLEFVKAVYLPEQLTPLEAPQIVLAGRSNVGKSSLVNCLAGRKGLAKVSATPGKTRSLNFYRATPEGFLLVDLPGYGYAVRSKAERAAWGRLVEAYLKSASGLKAAVMLIDCRHPPQKNDLELSAFLRERGLPVLPVLVKAYKAGQKEQAVHRAQWAGILRVPEPPLLFSSKTGLGREALWERLSGLALGPQSR